jgi:2-amino-4-hydroxy-6-hydroxymethyldihydropteridine diphosphokinase
MNTAIISLGSNIDKERNLPEAVRMLGEMCWVVALSRVYETLPVGLPDQPNFLNAAVAVETALGPAALKREVLAVIEQRLGRVRTADKNAPRTIDLDLALFNDEVREYNGHQLPDPDLLRFAHVALPIADLAPEMPHPQTGEPMRAIAQRLLAKATTENGGQAPLWVRGDVGIGD